ncbi:MAG TPA: hypothetical protein VHO50_12480 [Bacteroidales bacterium]|nr:hypothetical protein [Bacteroidales bacterium]
MNENKLMQQVVAIFSVFMVFFYVGVGLFFLFFFERSTIDKPMKVIIGITFLIYGIYRIFKTYTQIVEAFSRKNKINSEYPRRKI